MIGLRWLGQTHSGGRNDDRGWRSQVILAWFSRAGNPGYVQLIGDEPEAAAYRAGRLMLQEIDRLAGHGVSFALESTLSGKTYVSRILDWRRRGYLVELFFLSLPSADFAVSRVRQRVQEGGHDVPETTVRRRFAAGLDNFERLYKPIVDAWAMYDNSSIAPILLEQGSHHDENDQSDPRPER